MSAARMMGKVKLGWAKHGSTITFVFGLFGAVGAGVLGGFGAVKAKRIIDQKDEDVTRIKEQVGKPMMVDGKERTYTQEDADHDLKITKRETIKGVAKALAPAVALGGASVGLLTYSHLNQAGKVASLASYASALEQQCERGYQLLKDEVGEEKAQMAMAGYHTEEQVVEKVDEETGEITQSVEKVLVKDLDAPADGIFTFTFHKGMWEWSENYDRNVTIVKLRMREYQTHMEKFGAVTLDYLMDCFEAPCEDRHGYDHICGNLWEAGKIIEYTILPPLGNGDNDVTFIVKTDGYILNKIDQARADYEKKIRMRH